LEIVKGFVVGHYFAPSLALSGPSHLYMSRKIREGFRQRGFPENNGPFARQGEVHNMSETNRHAWHLE